jgi:hypothetical protein
MMRFIRNLFIHQGSETREKDDFSDFFLNAKSGEKAKVIRQVLREANKEQRELVEKYRQKFSVGVFELAEMDIR